MYFNFNFSYLFNKLFLNWLYSIIIKNKRFELILLVSFKFLINILFFFKKSIFKCFKLLMDIIAIVNNKLYTLYTFILIYLLPSIFRVLKYQVKKFEILITQINFLNLSSNQGNINYINVLNTFITLNLKILINYKKNYNLNLQTNQKNSYNNLNNILDFKAFNLSYFKL